MSSLARLNSAIVHHPGDLKRRIGSHEIVNRVMDLHVLNVRIERIVVRAAIGRQRECQDGGGRRKEIALERDHAVGVAGVKVDLERHRRAVQPWQVCFRA